MQRNDSTNSPEEIEDVRVVQLGQRPLELILVAVERRLEPQVVRVELRLGQDTSCSSVSARGSSSGCSHVASHRSSLKSHWFS